MTASNQWTSDQLQTLRGFITAANRDLALGTQAGADAARGAITQYYTYQAGLGRGYAKLALGVVTNTTFEGQVAVDVLQDAAGSGITQNTETELLVALATSDNQIMQTNGGFWPTVDDIETYHYQDYQFYDLPVFAWGGAASAYFGQDWGVGYLTSYEIGDGSHSTLFQNMTVDQVQQNVNTLTGDGLLKVGQALLDSEALANIDPATVPQDFLALLQTDLSNNTPSLTDIVAAFKLDISAIALVNGTAQITQAQAQLAANQAFINATGRLPILLRSSCGS